MEHPQNTEFSIRPTTEQTPFQDIIHDRPMRQVFSKWCEVNSIKPKYVSREEWDEQKKNGILQKQPDGKESTLIVREDLQLWGMFDVIEAVDKDTFAHDPGKRKQLLRTKRKEFNELGDMFVNAGIYMAKRMGRIQEGKPTAEKTAKDFYRYGNALRTGNYDEQTPITDIADNTLSPRQTEEIDKWFGVDKKDRLKTKTEAMTQWIAAGRPKDDEGNPITKGWDIPDTMEQTRQEMLTQFFKVTEKAKEGSEPHRKALEKVHQRYLKEPINRPEQELHDAILRRGLEKIVNEMGKDGWRDEVKEAFKEGLGIDLEGQSKNLREILEIPRLKTELALVRETGDVAKISDKEREVALKIQEAVSRIPYDARLLKAGTRIMLDAKTRETIHNQGKGAFPSQIAQDQEIICVGATLVGGKLLQDVGISYLGANVPGHSLTTLITSEGKVYWQDFLAPSQNVELNDENLARYPNSGQAFTVKDIVAYSQAPHKEPLVGRGLQYSRLALFSPEQAEKCDILLWTSTELAKHGNYRAAMVASRKAVDTDPTDASIFAKHGGLAMKAGNYEEALSALIRSSELSNEMDAPYAAFASVLKKLPNRDAKLDALMQAASKDPRSIELFGQIMNSTMGMEEGDDDKRLRLDIAQGVARVFPEDIEANDMLANTLGSFDTNAYREASERTITLCQKALEANPNDTKAYNKLGDVLDRLGNEEEALDAYTKALELGQKDVGLYYKHATLSRKLGKKDLATESYHKIIQLGDQLKDRNLISIAESELERASQ